MPLIKIDKAKGLVYSWLIRNKYGVMAFACFIIVAVFTWIIRMWLFSLDLVYIMLYCIVTGSLCGVIQNQKMK